MASTTKALGQEGILNTIRNLSIKDLVTVGVVSAELLGFFTVGEMIGKFKVVGYRGDVHAGAAAH